MLPQNVNLGSHHLLFKSVFFHCCCHSSFHFLCCDLNHINSQNDQDSKWRRVYQILIRAPSVRISVLFHMIDFQFFGGFPISGVPGALKKGVMLWIKLRNSSKLAQDNFIFKNTYLLKTELWTVILMILEVICLKEGRYNFKDVIFFLFSFFFFEVLLEF